MLSSDRARASPPRATPSALTPAVQRSSLDTMVHPDAYRRLFQMASQIGSYLGSLATHAAHVASNWRKPGIVHRGVIQPPDRGSASQRQPNKCIHEVLLTALLTTCAWRTSHRSFSHGMAGRLDLRMKLMLQCTRVHSLHIGPARSP